MTRTKEHVEKNTVTIKKLNAKNYKKIFLSIFFFINKNGIIRNIKNTQFLQFKNKYFRYDKSTLKDYYISY
jgi:hypothetical protein